MLIYWLLFAYFALGALVAPLRQPGERTIPLFYIAGGVLVALMIGLRYRVGADWDTYILIFDTARRYGFWRMISVGDPAYEALNWVVFHSNGDIWVVNLVAGAIFSWGLFRFCRTQPAPWLAVAVAIPYMAIVVAMGYTRQGIALGILMAGLASQARGKSIINFAVYVAVAATFHASAAVVFPLVALAGRGNRIVSLLMLIAGSYVLYDIFLGNNVDRFVQLYIRSGYSSQGALIRVTMNMVAAILFWTFRKRLPFDPHQYKIWRNFSFAAVAFLFLLAVSPSSTAVDRMSLYIMPLQIAVLGHFALVAQNRVAGVAPVLGYMTAVQFVWLNFAQHARYWVPYQIYPF